MIHELCCAIAARYVERGLFTVIERAKGQWYLLRLYLRGGPRVDQDRWVNAYLHRFYSDDELDELHNHPWKWSFSIVLTVGYWEERLRSDGTIKRRLIKPWRINWISNSTFHRVELINGRPAWTLFISGPRTDKPRDQAWGFYDVKTKAYRFWTTHPTAKG